MPRGAIGRYRAHEYEFLIAESRTASATLLLERTFGDLQIPNPPWSREPTPTYLLNGPDEGYWSVSVDGAHVIRGALSTALSGLMWHVNQQATRSPMLTFLHAGAVEKDGRVVVLAAPMESGKTTTTTGLLRAGWRYLTDEAVGLTGADGLAHPYPKPLSIDPGSWPLFPDLAPDGLEDKPNQWLVAASRIRSDVVAGPGPIGLICLPRYQAGITTAATALKPAELVMQLAHSTFHFPDGADRHLPRLAQLARDVPGFSINIGDLRSAITVIEELAASV